LALYARQVIGEALQLAELTGTEAVLDACCGTGELLQLIALREHRGTLIGVDFSETMLNVAANRLRNYPNVTLKHQRIENLQLPSDYFHIVFNTNAFHYLDEPEATLREFQRVLRPHGRLILTDLAANSRLTWLWSQARRIFRPTHARLYRLEEMIDYLRRQGFVVLRKRLLRINLLWSVMLIEAQNPAPGAKGK
jgi:ubiquinone/menaquinone biosynthesis C-methylase UbiE